MSRAYSTMDSTLKGQAEASGSEMAAMCQLGRVPLTVITHCSRRSLQSSNQQNGFTSYATVPFRAHISDCLVTTPLARLILADLQPAPSCASRILETSG